MLLFRSEACLFFWGGSPRKEETTHLPFLLSQSAGIRAGWREIRRRQHPSPPRSWKHGLDMAPGRTVEKASSGHAVKTWQFGSSPNWLGPPVERLEYGYPFYCGEPSPKKGVKKGTTGGPSWGKPQKVLRVLLVSLFTLLKSGRDSVGIFRKRFIAVAGSPRVSTHAACKLSTVVRTQHSGPCPKKHVYHQHN